MEAGGVRAVLDTSVLVPEGSRRDLQQLAALGLYRGYWSPWIIAELNRVLAVKWLQDTQGDMSARNLASMGRAAKAMMSILLQSFEVITPEPPYPPAWPGLVDGDDVPVWAAASTAEARYVVSHNTRDYPPADDRGRHIWEGVEYVSAEAFVRRVLSDFPQ